MSSEEVGRKLIETFLDSVNSLNKAVTEMSIKFDHFSATQERLIAKLDETLLELRELKTAFYSAIRK
ncbi:MAG: hypothetical protein QXI60_03185 [Thermofilaceae archaeon]